MKTILRRLTGLALAVMIAIGGAAAFGETEKETVRWRSLVVDKDTEYVDLGERGVSDWANFYKFLEQLPNLKKVDMFGTVPNMKTFNEMHRRFPGVDFGVSLRFGKHRMRTDDEAFSTLFSEGDKEHSYNEISQLRYCRNLYALDIGHHPVRNLDFLYDLPELRVLILVLNHITDITPIASLKHLEYLEIFHNYIEDVSPLQDLPYLMDLNLDKNRVKDLTPVANIKSLRRLWVGLCDTTTPSYPDAETLKMLQEALPDCHIDAVSNPTDGGWHGDSEHFAIIYRMWRTRKYEPFPESDPENWPELYRQRVEAEKAGETAETVEAGEAGEPAETAESVEAVEAVKPVEAGEPVETGETGRTE